MQLALSKLDNNQTLVIYVDDGDRGPIVDLLDNRGLGYAVFGDDVDIPFAVVDRRILGKDGYTSDHVLAIEAHELGHIHNQSDDEVDAETAAIRLLKESGMLTAADILTDRGII